LEERKNLFSYAQFHIRAPGSHITDWFKKQRIIACLRLPHKVG
jgi:hypothetical protein